MADNNPPAGPGATENDGNEEQQLPRTDWGADEMGSPQLGALGTSGEMSNQDDVAGFGPEGAGGLHGTPPTWFGTPLGRAEKQAEQGGNPPATTPVSGSQAVAAGGSNIGSAQGAERNDWQVSAGDAASADQQPATGTEPPGTFGPVGPGQRGDLGPQEAGTD